MLTLFRKQKREWKKIVNNEDAAVIVTKTYRLVFKVIHKIITKKKHSLKKSYTIKYREDEVGIF